MTAPDPFAADVAAAQAAQTAAATLQAKVAADEAQIAADQATIAAQAAQIAQLEGEEDTAWGANIPHGTLPAVDSAFGGIQAVRWYWPVPAAGQKAVLRFPTAADLGADLGSRIVIESFKAPPADVAAGKYDADLAAAFAAAPRDRKTRFGYHEPEDNIAKGQYSLADLHAAWARITPIARAAGPHILLTPIFMQYTLDPASGRKLSDYLPADFDEFGFDFYPTSTAAIGTMIGRMKAAAAAVGKPWFVGEVGTLGNTAILTALAQALAAEHLPAACWFDGGNNQISNNPTALAAWRNGQH